MTVLVNNYQLSIDHYDTRKLNDVILEVNYAGDKARLYKEGMLRADDFYNGTEWRISLNRIGLRGKRLRLSIYPLSPDKKIYFDELPQREMQKMGSFESKPYTIVQG